MHDLLVQIPRIFWITIGFDIPKSRNELGFNPKKLAAAVKEASDYLMKHKYLLR